MAAFAKYDQFAVDLAAGVHDLTTAGALLRIGLTNRTPVDATDEVFATAAEITYTNLSTTDGDSTIPTDIINVGSETPAGTWDVAGSDIVYNAAGAVATFQWVVLYNDTPSSPVDPLIGYWDYGSGVTLANGESFTVDFGASIFTVT